MILVLLLALCLVGLAVALAFRAQAGDAVRGQETLTNISAYGFNADERAAAVTGRDRLNRVADTLGEIYSRHAGEDRERQVLELLRAAGLYRMRPVTFVGYRLLATLGLSLFLLWFLTAAGVSPAAVFFVVLLFGALG